MLLYYLFCKYINDNKLYKNSSYKNYNKIYIYLKILFFSLKL